MKSMKQKIRRVRRGEKQTNMVKESQNNPKNKRLWWKEKWP